jgi:hypothetical protein
MRLLARLILDSTTRPRMLLRDYQLDNYTESVLC